MQPVILVVGESLVDVVHARDGSVTARPGGSAANVAVALARLGRPVRFATSFAEDDHGAMLAAHLQRAGVETVGDPRVVERTSVATATIGPSGAATYDFDVDWQLADPSALLSSSDAAAVTAVHLGSYAAVLQPGAHRVEALARGLRDTATLSYDVNARPELTGVGPDVVARVERLIGLSDVVKASDEDLAALYPGMPEADVVARLLASGPAAFVVTRGGSGATVTTAAGTVDVPALDRGLADTIGAGDTFSAAILDALWELGRLGAPARTDLHALGTDVWRAILGHAAAAAAVTVSRPGADPPHRAELPPLSPAG